MDKNNQHPGSCSAAGKGDPKPKNSGGFQCEMWVTEANNSEASGAENLLPEGQFLL